MISELKVASHHQIIESLEIIILSTPNNKRRETPIATRPKPRCADEIVYFNAHGKYYGDLVPLLRPFLAITSGTISVAFLKVS